MGVEKIDNELDIRHITTELRTLKIISHILLNKHQRRLIPFFRQNLLNDLSIN